MRSPAHATRRSRRLAGRRPTRQPRATPQRARFAAHPPVRLVVAVDARQTPDRGSLGLIAELADHAQATRIWLAGVDAAAEQAGRLRQWREGLAGIGLGEAAALADAGAACGWLERGGTRPDERHPARGRGRPHQHRQDLAVAHARARRGFGEVSDSAGTTRHVEGLRLMADGVPAAELFDTPGMEDAIALLEFIDDLVDPASVSTALSAWRASSPATRPQAASSRRPKVLRQMLASDAALYVVDARDPVLPKHRDELELLAACARPLLPVLNFIADPVARADDWRGALARPVCTRWSASTPWRRCSTASANSSTPWRR